jgi:hypothetical protein
VGPKAPHGQLPYLVDGNTTIGDSDATINHLISRHTLAIDKALTPGQRDTDLLVRRMLGCAVQLSVHCISGDDGERTRRYVVGTCPVRQQLRAYSAVCAAQTDKGLSPHSGVNRLAM